MLVMYCKKQNLLGLWEDGWNVVLVSRLVFVHSPGRGLGTSMASELHTYGSNWTVIGSL